MRGRTVLITGSTGGIGQQTARRLAALGARVLLVGRDSGRAEAAAREMARQADNPRVEALTADVSRQGDLARLAGQVLDRCERLDVLVNNAGVARERRETTEDGVEATFAANVLGPFALTHALLPALRRGGEGRVVNLTGGVPRGALDLGNLQAERSFVGLAHYNQTKLALMAMSRVFARRAEGSGVTVNVAYPGHAYTAMNRGLSASSYPAAARPLVPLLRLLMPVLYGDRALVRASDSSVYLASSDEAAGVNGVYFDHRGRRSPWPACVRDEHACAVVWDVCAQLSGIGAS